MKKWDRVPGWRVDVYEKATVFIECPCGAEIEHEFAFEPGDEATNASRAGASIA